MNRERKGKGIVLIIILCFMLLFVIIATSFMFISSSEIKMVRKQNNSTKAFYIAEGGLERARYDLWKDNNWTDGEIDGTNYVKTDTDSDGFYLLNYNTATRASLGGEFTVRLKEIEGSTNKIWVKSKSSYNNAIRTIKAKVKSARRFGPTTVDYAIETEGNIVIHGNVTINPEGSYNPNATLNFEELFGATKEELEEIAKEYFPDTYYTTIFDNSTATADNGGPTLTWVSAPTGEQSQITRNDWRGAGILIVEGDLKITGGIFNGVIWVSGVLRISGNPVITGAIFVEGGVTVDTEITGTAIINKGSQNDIANAFSPLTSLPPMIDNWQEVSR